MPVRSTEWEGVYADGPWLLTRNLVPGAVVYGEGLVREKGREFRRWDANRSKLAAYLKRGVRVWPFRFRSSVLYLGAGSGTTASHVSDVCADGTVAAVEISPVLPGSSRAFGKEAESHSDPRRRREARIVRRQDRLRGRPVPGCRSARSRWDFPSEPRSAAIRWDRIPDGEVEIGGCLRVARNRLRFDKTRTGPRPCRPRRLSVPRALPSGSRRVRRPEILGASPEPRAQS